MISNLIDYLKRSGMKDQIYSDKASRKSDLFGPFRDVLNDLNGLNGLNKFKL
jgi:hypothetical protein